MTHLYGDRLIEKDAPVIVFRGKLDSLCAMILEAQVLGKEKGNREFVNDLQEILEFVRSLLSVEYKCVPPGEFNILGYSSKELRERSHNPEKYFGRKHLLMHHSMGALSLRLNLLRAAAREAELAAVAILRDPTTYNPAFCESQDTARRCRKDIVEALNRLSGLFYILIYKYLPKDYSLMKGVNMKQAIIGVIPLWDEKKDSIWMLPGYMQGLEEAGAMPVILNLTISETVLKQAACFFDGFLFTGGHDVNPKLYGQEKTAYCEEICDIRDQMEAYIFREAVLNQNKPALGICRGIQLFNVLLGGTLYQDIPAELPGAVTHTKGPPYDVPAHNVRLIPGSPLSELTGKEYLEVNSYHHQGINRIAKGLEVMALADDGLTEAVYMPDRSYVWAVQWHPEFSLKDEISKKIFSSFVKSVERGFP